MNGSDGTGATAATTSEVSLPVGINGAKLIVEDGVE